MQTTGSNGPSREVARLMLMMRRLVKEEFTVTIHLDDPTATEELLAFADRSRSSLLRGMARELEAIVPARPDTPVASSARRYRGAVAAADPDPKDAAVVSAVTPSEPTARPARVYRGRTVA